MAGYFMNIERRYFLELFYGKSTIVFYLFFFFIHYILSRNNKDNYQANFYIEYNLRYNVHNLWIIIVLLLWRPVAHEKPIHMIFERLTIMSPSDEHKISFRLLLMVQSLNQSGSICNVMMHRKSNIAKKLWLIFINFSKIHNIKIKKKICH